LADAFGTRRDHINLTRCCRASSILREAASQEDTRVVRPVQQMGSTLPALEALCQSVVNPAEISLRLIFHQARHRRVIERTFAAS